MTLLVAVFIALSVAYLGALAAARFLFTLALDRSRDKHLVLRNLDWKPSPQDEDLRDPYSRASVARWRETVPREDRYRETADGVRLHASVLANPAGGDRWAVVLHGYAMRQPLSVFAKRFYDAGFHLLVPTLRGHGESGSRYITMGWLDRLDVAGWIEALAVEHPAANVVVHGVSMGAATALMASGEALPGQVRCVVADCGYTGVEAEFRHQLKTFFRLPAFPVLPMAGRLVKKHLGFDLCEASAVEQLKKSQLPTLLIHGEQDRFVPAWMIDPLYAAAPEPKEKLVVEGAGHGTASRLEPELYWNTVWAFIDKHI